MNVPVKRGMLLRHQGHFYFVDDLSTIQLRQKAKAIIDVMSGAQLRVASEFLAFVKDRRTDAATLQLLSIPGFEASYARGMRDIKAGRTKPWRKVRSHVWGSRNAATSTNSTRQDRNAPPLAPRPSPLAPHNSPATQRLLTTDY